MMLMNPHEGPVPIEQYFLLMQNGQDRSEYYAGQLRMMSGGTSDHATITGNMYIALRQALADDPTCVPYMASKMVRLDPNNVVFPDVVVSGDHADHGQSLVIESPLVVVEVLPRTVQIHDRTRKLVLYQARESIHEIIFVSQEVQWVEAFQRTPEGWFYKQYDSRGCLRLECLDIEIEVAQIYARLAIPTALVESKQVH